MKKVVTLLIVLLLSVSCIFYANAEDGKVTYNGNAGEFVFAPGGDYSLTDLFPEFKDVMPGDSITQKITVKNDADNKVKVKIYIRSLGAHEDSVEFLSMLNLQVKKSEDNEMAYMFEAAADKTAGLTDWVCLGTLYSGGVVNLDAVLNVPVELDNKFQNSIGYLDWEFKIEEFPIDEGDPQPPKTGDNYNLGLWITLMICSFCMIIILLIWRKKDKKETTNA